MRLLNQTLLHFGTQLTTLFLFVQSDRHTIACLFDTNFYIPKHLFKKTQVFISLTLDLLFSR